MGLRWRRRWLWCESARLGILPGFTLGLIRGTPTLQRRRPILFLYWQLCSVVFPILCSQQIILTGVSAVVGRDWAVHTPLCLSLGLIADGSSFFFSFYFRLLSNRALGGATHISQNNREKQRCLNRAGRRFDLPLFCFPLWRSFEGKPSPEKQKFSQMGFKDNVLGTVAH